MKKISMLIVAMLLIVPSLSFATTEKEKAELARLVSELKYLKEDVLKVSELRRADDTEAFNYEALFNDLDTVQQAVERHINTPSRQPRKLRPLEAEHGYIH